MKPPVDIPALEALARSKGIPFLPITHNDFECGWVRTTWGRYVTWEEMEYILYV